ncbi:MAG: UDP-N-acetylenolpyruvoylglucosamine reductase [Flavobacteriaceae bacterium]|nr:MAG: UDP-N-acetylenolpyruvoylglucosamine reductase [Flavobacteriaceae bacterium]
MNIQHNISLKKYNTFGIDAKAKFFCEINSPEELKQVLKLKEYPKKFIISGGSNVLITKDLNSLVVHINIKGKKIVEENDNYVIVHIMAGENWHNIVLWAIENQYGGLENLSLIPGNTGTAPIQNIGAYGVELKDIFVSCEALDVATLEIRKFTKEDCKFGYRNSIFKNEGKGKYIITSVNLKLTKKKHQLNTSYGDIVAQLQKSNINAPTIKDVSNAVITIRKSKLPDPNELGNSGSFFKNPILNLLEFAAFSKENPNAPFYKMSENEFKVPAGWLIEQCGFKGKRFGDAGVHKKQALVLVNYGNATGQEILNLSLTIRKSAFQKFGIDITPEVNIIK